MESTRYDQLVARGVRADNGCLLWPGATTGAKDPYGVAHVDGKLRTIHRAVFIHFNGEPPEGYVVSHSCETPLCFERTHLVAETQQKNLLRRQTINHPNAAKTTCPRGHEYDLVYKNGKRGCRTCDRARAIKDNERRRRLRIAS